MILFVNKAFAELINRRGVHKKLGVKPGIIRTYRYNLAHGIAISTEAKIKILKKSGWTPDDKIYSRRDLVSLLKFYCRTSQAARDNGPEYVIEKWEQTK